MTEMLHLVHCGLVCVAVPEETKRGEDRTGNDIHGLPELRVLNVKDGSSRRVVLVQHAELGVVDRTLQRGLESQCSNDGIKPRRGSRTGAA